MKEEKMMQYRDSDVGRMSNVEDVLSALKDDDAEYLAMLKVRERELVEIYARPFLRCMHRCMDDVI
jgi:hypothetical protein